MAYFYMEHDGREYTVWEGRLTLPREGEAIPFPIGLPTGYL